MAIGDRGDDEGAGMDIPIDKGNVLWVSNDQAMRSVTRNLLRAEHRRVKRSVVNGLNNWMSDQHDDLVEVIKRKLQPKLW